MVITHDDMANCLFRMMIKIPFHHRFNETKYHCPKCRNKLDIYYCEETTYAVRCLHCETLTITRANNTHEAAKKVGIMTDWNIEDGGAE